MPITTGHPLSATVRCPFRTVCCFRTSRCICLRWGYPFCAVCRFRKSWCTCPRWDAALTLESRRPPSFRIVCHARLPALQPLSIQVLKHLQSGAAQLQLCVSFLLFPPMDPRFVHAQRAHPAAGCRILEAHCLPVVGTERIRAHLSLVDGPVDVILPTLPVQFVLDPALSSLMLSNAILHPLDATKAYPTIQMLSLIQHHSITGVRHRRVPFEPRFHPRDTAGERGPLLNKFFRRKGPAHQRV
mmetsp:Transcript_32317/g.78266  ORF Transcript_32317/g.78266 Transcript_32317/m.78266 type:complete len:243 (-) Transcript_32317:644-1372(-)